MDASYNKEEYEDEGTTLVSKPSTPDPHNPGHVLQQKNFWDTTTKQILTTTIPIST